jgi:ligand-binding SRPBCC domain-containing protein
VQSFYLQREQWLPNSSDKIFAFFSRPENLQKLTPPWLDFRLVVVPEQLSSGALIRYCLRWHFLPISWTTEIAEWSPPHRFVDRALSGPYALWNHEHSFESQDGGTTMRDRVRYALPLGFFGTLAHRLWVKRDIERIFDYRAQKMRELFPGIQACGSQCSAKA